MDAITLALPFLIALILVALAFDFLNGLHDAANSIATIVSTRVLRPQHPGRDDGGDRIGGVVQSVEEVEQQRDGDQSDQERKTKRGVHCAALPYTCSITIELISLATSSKRSATFSR